jgi:hypothetical protein
MFEKISARSDGLSCVSLSSSQGIARFIQSTRAHDKNALLVLDERIDEFTELIKIHHDVREEVSDPSETGEVRHSFLWQSVAPFLNCYVQLTIFFFSPVPLRLPHRPTLLYVHPFRHPNLLPLPSRIILSSSTFLNRPKDTAFVTGLLHTDSLSQTSSKLTPTSLLLQSSRARGSGSRTPLRFADNVLVRGGPPGVPGAGLFVGCICGFRGKNASGGWFLVEEILLVRCSVYSPLRLRQGGTVVINSQV